MTDKFLESSDSVRNAKPLKYAQQVTFEDPLELEFGGRLPQIDVTYETYGRLNAARDNAVLICHAISGDSHVAGHDEQDDPGWWDIAGIVGPGKPIDTDRFFVVCPNILGSCRGTTGPNSINPETHKPYGRDFPTITVGDMVQVQRRLVDSLGIEKLLAVVGGSVGGHQVLAWAVKHPEKLRGAVPLATSARLSSQALAFDVVGRNAIVSDPNYQSGQYYQSGRGPNVGLAIARMIGHITYLSPEAMREKFGADRLRPRDVPTEFEKKFSVGSYLAHVSDSFVERFDANSYITLTMAMDLFDLGATPAELAEALNPSRCRWLVVSFTSDWLFPASQSQQIVNALIATEKPVTYCSVASSCGHDAFLLPNDADRYGELLRAFLVNLTGEKPVTKPPQGVEANDRKSTSIFDPERPDYDRIVELIEPRASVLDLGCGNGELLWKLKHRGYDDVMGVELAEQAILACVRRGLNVIQADLNEGQLPFVDKQFDFVVLSQTLQAVRDIEATVAEMLRVARLCIVTFPNFAYHKLRTMLYEQGRAPEAPGLLRFKWYDTPNVRFFSIKDFESFCDERDIEIHRLIALDTEEGREIREDPNLNADLAVFVISRNDRSDRGRAG